MYALDYSVILTKILYRNIYDLKKCTCSIAE